MVLISLAYDDFFLDCVKNRNIKNLKNSRE